MHDQHHEMILEKTHPSGAEEWYCPTCGRRFLLQWPPAYEMIILEAGDPYAPHSGGKGGMQMGPVQGAMQTEEISEPRLQPWIKALDDLNLDW